MSKGLYRMVGMKYRPENAQKLASALTAGAEVTLTREPKNDYDPNAIQVRVNGLCVGFIEGRKNRGLALHIDQHGAPPEGDEPGPKMKAKFANQSWPAIEVET